MIATGDWRTAARILAASAFALALPLCSAQAQPSQAELSAIKSNCRSDYMAHCMSVRPGGKEALQCLQSHLDSLSGACKGAVAATMPPPPAPAAAAPPPAPPPHKAAKAPPPPAPPPPKAAAAPQPPEAAAAPPPPAPARPAKAAAHHKKERMRATAPPAPVALAPPPAPPQPDPAELMARASQLPLPQRMRVFRACDQDQAIVCPGMRPGGGRIIACLAMHPDALSAFCRRAVTQAMQ